VKTIVFESDNKEAQAFPEVGLVFVPDVPTPVTDEQAAILLATFENQYLEGTAEEVAQMKRPDGLPYRPTPNPLFGKQKNPQFKLVEPEKPDPTPAAPVAAVLTSKIGQVPPAAPRPATDSVASDAAD